MSARTEPEWFESLRSYQKTGARWLLDMPRGARGRLLADPMGFGKALDINTPVPTPNGWTTMGALRDGDAVIGGDSRACTVVRAWPVDLLPLFRVWFSDGSYLDACGEHQWLVSNRDERAEDRSPTVRTTEYMAERLRQSWAVPICSFTAPSGDLLAHAYEFGFWLGDGHSKEPVISAPQKKLDLLGDVFEWIRPEKGTVLRAKFRAEILSKKNLLERSVFKDKRFPDAHVWCVSTRLEVLAGLVDSDGAVSKAGFVDISLSKKDLAEDVLLLVRALGMKATIHSRLPKISNRPDLKPKRSYRVCFTPSSQLQDHVRDPVKRARMTQPRRAEVAHLKYITNIVPLPGKRRARCITVDSSDSTYLAGDALTVTHNTRTALAASRLIFENLEPERHATTYVFSTASSANDWRREAARFWPELDTHVRGSEPTYQRKTESDEQFMERAHGHWRSMLKNTEKPSMVIMDYARAEEMLALMEENDTYPEHLILDEAHNVKRAGTKRSSFIQQIVGRTKTTTLLTGTPVHNRPYDLHMLLRMMTAQFSDKLYTFCRPYFHIKEGKYGRPGVIGELLDKTGLRRDVEPFMLSRSIKEAYGELPARQRILKMVQAPNVARISPAKARALKEGSKLDLALREAVRYKMEAGLELVQDLARPVVVYTYTREDARKFAAMVKAAKIPVTLATGDLSPERRDKEIEAWKTGATTVLVCTMDAVRESATLTRADAMVFLDFQWLPAVMMQNEGRIDPARQPENERRPVCYYYLVVEGGPDEVIAQAVIDKIREGAGIVGQNEDSTSLASFLAPLEDEPKAVTTLTPSEMLADLSKRLVTRANRLADLGLI